MRGRNTINFFKALDLIARPQGATIKQLSSKLGISTRSVRRKLDLIHELNFPIYDDNDLPGREKSWKIDADYVVKTPNIRLPDIRFNIKEIIALYLLRTESRIYAGTDIEKHFNAAFERMSLYVPDNFQKHLARLKSLFISPRKLAKDYSGKEEIIDNLTMAMIRNNTCLLSYYSFSGGETKKFKIDPLHFFESNGGLYLFVQVPRYNDIRTLAVERIEKLEQTTDVFEYPEDFDPEEKLSLAFDMVYDDPIELKVVFSPDQAKYIRERRFSPKQKITDNPDGSITLVMTTSGWFDVKRWLLGFGAAARVVKPDKMRQEIVAEMKKTISNY
ncbi:helix-turn-helix transcriptional regulator [Desulfonatronovibrio magnus]|uniref:helix-turn-helix transcriptional regulator n=1 Tax=Desulfonatronovibrio magnus TaxID=698827 RepID=UPI0005EB9D63|nr:WYL domain-containing transcriptional regulator [Desulfonatronovibrio magnus]